MDHKEHTRKELYQGWNTAFIENLMKMREK